MSEQDKAEIIIKEVCRYYNTSFEKINVPCRGRKLVEPRQVIMYFMNKNTGLSLRMIGDYFNRDHATTIHSVRTVTNLIQMNGFAGKTNIMAGRIDFNIQQFDVKKDADIFDRWVTSMAQY